MPALETLILEILDDQDNRMATAAYILDRLDRDGHEFSLSEFDDAIETLREDGHIRVKNASAPRNGWQLKRL